jgi:hypothetical protein
MVDFCHAGLGLRARRKMCLDTLKSMSPPAVMMKHTQYSDCQRFLSFAASLC